MDKAIQEQLEEQVDESYEAEVTENVVKPLKFSAEMIERDKRETDIVEINLKDGLARVVEESDAPKLTKKALKEKGAPLQVGKALFDGAVMEVDMWHGMPLSVDIGRSNIVALYKDRIQEDYSAFVERELAIKQFVLASLIPDAFSYEGVPKGLPPIEDCSEILIGALWNAFLELHYPVLDDIYQVKVMRGIPEDVYAMLGNTFEIYPVGEKLKTSQMTPDAIETHVNRANAQRAVLMSSLILEPALSYKGEGRGKYPYPVEKLSEWMLQCLDNAQKASNTPAGGQGMLDRFLQYQQNRVRKSGDAGDSADG